MPSSNETAKPILQEGQIFLGQYLIRTELGRGGYGAVYAADDLHLKRKVAIKVLHPEHVEDKKTLRRFQLEAVASSRMNHPCIVQVYSSGRAEDGTLYIVMEYVEGDTYQSRLKAYQAIDQRLSVTKVCQVIVQVARVMVAAHGRGIVHRDLKPHNLMLTSDEDAPGGERVKLLDFGIAKVISAPGTEDEDEGATSTGDQVPGTRAYMAPEQYSSYKGITGLEGRMDVYALGCILYLSLAGRLPLYDREHVVMMGLTLAKEPDPLLKINPSIPPELAELAHLMLVKEAVDRPTMVHVRDRLVNFLGLSESRAEIVAIRPTAEHQAMLAKFSTGEQEEERAGTGDLPDSGAIKAVKSVGERSTKMQLTSADLIMSTGRGLGQQLTGPETSARRRRSRMVAVVLLGGVVVGTGGAVAIWRIPGKPKLAAASTQPAPLSAVLAATPGVSALATSSAPAVGSPLTTQPASPPPEAPVPEPMLSKPKPKLGCVAPTVACITGAASTAQRRFILDALQEADIKFCQGDRLVLTGKPILTVRATSGVKHSRQESFLFSARGYLGKTTFDGELEIKCKGK